MLRKPAIRHRCTMAPKNPLQILHALRQVSLRRFPDQVVIIAHYHVRMQNPTKPPATLKQSITKRLSSPVNPKQIPPVIPSIKRMVARPFVWKMSLPSVQLSVSVAYTPKIKITAPGQYLRTRPAPFGLPFNSQNVAYFSSLLGSCGSSEATIWIPSSDPIHEFTVIASLQRCIGTFGGRVIRISEQT